MNWHLKLLHEPGITPFSLAQSILIYTFNIAVGYSHLWTLVCFYCSFFPGGSDGKASACQIQSLGWEDPLQKEMATHSSILAWKTAWMDKPPRLQSMELQRVGHNWVTSLLHCSFYMSCLSMFNTSCNSFLWYSNFININLTLWH